MRMKYKLKRIKRDEARGILVGYAFLNDMFIARVEPTYNGHFIIYMAIKYQNANGTWYSYKDPFLWVKGSPPAKASDVLSGSPRDCMTAAEVDEAIGKNAVFIRVPK